MPLDLRAFPAAAFCFADGDGDGVHDANETVHLVLEGCAGAVRTLDPAAVRLTGSGAGSLLNTSALRAAGIRPLPGASVQFADLDRDGGWDPGDALYLVLDPGRAEVAAGDVRLVAAGAPAAGSVVATDDADAGRPVQAQATEGPFDGSPAARWRWWDADGSGAWGLGDSIYLDLDGSGDASVGDVRVSVRGRAFGTVLLPGDADAVPFLARVPATARVCFADVQGGRYDPGEPVYFRAEGCPAPGGAGAALATGDVRLNGPDAGTRVAEGDDDAGLPVHLLSASVRYSDLNRDGRWSTGDVLYLQSGAVRTVSAGDVRLTSFGSFLAGSVVGLGNVSDSDLKFLTNDRSTGGRFDAQVRSWKFWDVDRDGRFAGRDLLIVDVDGDGRLGPFDVRLARGAGSAYGSVVRFPDADARPPVLAPAMPSTACFADADGNGTYDPGEAVYFQRPRCRPVAAGDLRLTGAQAGSFVGANDADVNVSVLALPGAGNARFYDADGSGAWSRPDTLYLHAAAGRGAVEPGDLRVSPYGGRAAGTAVRASDPDTFLPTLAFAQGSAAPSRWRSWDTNVDGRLGTGDILYIDIDNSGSVTPLDLRVSLVNASVAPESMLVRQVPELLRTIESLEALAAEQQAHLEALNGTLAAQNATLSELQQELAEERNASAGLREQLSRRDAGDAQATPSPGALVVLAALGAAALAAARLRRPR